ncbi:Flagellar basal-body rod protein FlgF [Sodalis glossinidius str. 'morsitans']|uniref:Flagellar basal-body rod protein FlgF n=1 Tax=Sodalis glossinidius (strain morsitans) TaxID=343509 RepID=A0A193QMG2_SODGM|nr:Flagellar basal-body rod protein FlgF [Sodalis glossinidius str. 'morsitans']
MDHAIYTAMGAAAVPVEGESLPTRTLSVASTPGALMTPGPMQTTDRPLDVALGGAGFLAVQLPDGQEAYTRNGNI